MGKKKLKKNCRANATSRPGSRKTASQKKNQKIPTISVCMMVKNEEELLPRCLESIKEFVHEIIVVDTGSTDETVAIAEKYGAKIYHHPWENDFSKHRNQSIGYAVSDWIMIMDADEEFFSEDAARVKRTLQETDADFLYLQCHDLQKDGMQKGFLNQVRIFKNHLGMHYTQRVHNQLQTTGEGEYTRLRFRHYGYDLSPEKMAAKHVRTTSLLKRAIKEDPEDGYSLYQLAASYSMHKDYIKVVEYGEKALDVRRRKNLSDAFYLNTFYLVAAAFYTLNDMESARYICLEAEEIFGICLDICHIFSAVYFKQGSNKQCREVSMRYLAIYRQLQDDPSKIGSGSCYCFIINKRSQVFTGLACTYFIDKDYQTADTYFHKAFEDTGRQMEHAENVYRFYQEQQMDDKAMQWLATAYEAGYSQDKIPETIKEHPGIYIEIAKHYLQHDAPDSAHQYLRLAQDNQLTMVEQVEKRLLQIRLFWVEGAIEDLVKKLESLLALLGIQVDRCLNSFDDLGRLFYDMAELFVEQQQWHLAEPTLKLATQIAPNLFEPEKFQELMAGTEQ